MKKSRDRVSGYTITQIEAVLSNSNSLPSFRENLRNRYPHNPSRVHLNELFDQYIRLSR